MRFQSSTTVTEDERSGVPCSWWQEQKMQSFCYHCCARRRRRLPSAMDSVEYIAVHHYNITIDPIFIGTCTYVIWWAESIGRSDCSSISTVSEPFVCDNKLFSDAELLIDSLCLYLSLSLSLSVAVCECVWRIMQTDRRWHDLVHCPPANTSQALYSAVGQFKRCLRRSDPGHWTDVVHPNQSNARLTYTHRLCKEALFSRRCVDGRRRVAADPSISVEDEH